MALESPASRATNDSINAGGGGITESSWTMFSFPHYYFFPLFSEVYPILTPRNLHVLHKYRASQCLSCSLRSPHACWNCFRASVKHAKSLSPFFSVWGELIEEEGHPPTPSHSRSPMRTPSWLTAIRQNRLPNQDAAKWDGGRGEERGGDYRGGEERGR